MARWELVSFAAGCAERIGPVVKSLGSEAQIEVLEAGLTVAWQAAAGDVDESDAERALGDVTISARTEEAFSHLPEYQAARALNLLSYSLAAAVRPDFIETAKSACAEALEMNANFDFLLTYPAGFTMKIGPHETPPRGPLEIGEIAAQWETLRLLLERQASKISKIEAVRSFSQERASLIAREMPHIKQREGWSK